MLKNIKELTPKELGDVLSDWNEPRFRADQIFSWIYKNGVLDFNRMSNLSPSLRKRLKEGFSILDLELIKKLESSDGTQKLILRTEDKNIIEVAVIPTDQRVTGCISSQAGCAWACSFCASGIGGLKRNLASAEILEEILYIKENSVDNRLTHLVFMGTGEPMDNYDNVMKAIRIINSPETLNIGARRITISTCGIIPGIKRLSGEGLQVELSVSLHSPDDLVRSQLMPVNKKYPLKNLILACKEYIQKTNRQVTFEYCLVEGINSGLPEAQKLVTMLLGLNCKVNLIPFNPAGENNFAPPGKIKVLLFRDYLIKHGLNVTLRKERGRDIDAACGQLRLRTQNERSENKNNA
ncbi:MAG: 23S rRNA (adenine(2503)-C(2))-methyltransferase RlmN [Candidatus Omnitrophota bacterium]|nr:23S rRNA (adenine(2503)-C(2))-methyltransferase RlmN [Candidatus Omnitrophota bacterium]MBU1928685.1 23S rRNA (adenine(2503)-C(2))-methyltransferase RlmN [Candidatus Omnitrophota bacterium]MBU2035750.1 23S rRNA (adenine(2503)-C(2))-methyltransferase RlmN [Candidatus Omnitrophota bacterium]MBU2221521.1 23S rRNA (adenine(2503)-C(2))-methyltransferase RlmN [Candidatus Omnitrophota bacterium]MBU2258853.1 23S rRNA (adenine(2503)-C(2))-methyltransferase RlmN [Candidatus Omnitrophota bacterium]